MFAVVGVRPATDRPVFVTWHHKVLGSDRTDWAIREDMAPSKADIVTGPERWRKGARQTTSDQNNVKLKRAVEYTNEMPVALDAG